MRVPRSRSSSLRLRRIDMAVAEGRTCRCHHGLQELSLSHGRGSALRCWPSAAMVAVQSRGA